MGPGATRRPSTIASRPYGARSAGCSGSRPVLRCCDARRRWEENMADEDPRVEFRREAEELLARLRGLPDDDTVKAGQDFVKVARSAREFATLSKVAEAVSRQAPKDSTTRRYYAQALIETGHATVAVDVLRPLLKDKNESAEANLALRNWPEVEAHLRRYVRGKGIDAFALGGTLRQFTEVWNLDADPERGRPLVDILRARTMSLPGATLDLSPAEVRRLATAQPPSGQPEAVLGVDGPRTYKWMQIGMTRGQAVGAVRRKSTGGRHGTCFLVKASLRGLENDQLVVLTNHHVVNQDGTGLGIRPSAAEVEFEALANAPRLDVAAVVWSSPQENLDASILRLGSPPVNIDPLAPTAYLPVLGETQQVYIIGYPGGDELAISFQDNQLIDHEGPPSGAPTVPGRVRLHYRTPTKEGSSGSPVFNEDWEVVGLHHFGGKLGVEKLNGKPGIYAANEGIWIQSIVKAPK